jgi:protease IV
MNGLTGGIDMKRLFLIGVVILPLLCCTACTGPRITLFPDGSEPLEETTLDGEGADKVLVVSISGIITDAPGRRLLSSRPGVVQEVVSHLRLAERDAHVKAVLLKIDSPGGATTASDLLYHEILDFKTRTGKIVVACMMNLAASGGYYVALPADLIVAHPTTVTGSIGVILIRPEVSDLMQTLGVGVAVNKSGANKDMGSPFRPATPAEDRMLQEIVDRLGKRFLDLVKKHRKPDEDQLASIADARVFLADDALAAGLVDRIGYLQDAIDAARQLAGMDTASRVVVYRRTRYADDNLYNTLGSSLPASRPLLDLGPLADLFSLQAGFYYIWPQALAAD